MYNHETFLKTKFFEGKCYYANNNNFITNLSIIKVGVNCYGENKTAVSFIRCFDCWDKYVIFWLEMTVSIRDKTGVWWAN